MDEKKEFEWLTLDICKEYKARADQLPPNDGQDTKEWRSLREELQKRCNLTETEAFNILRGYNVRDYIQRQALLSGEIPMPESLRKKKKKSEDDDGPKDKSKKKKRKNEYEEQLEEYKNRIAELESQSINSAYAIEEND